jgi:glutathione S-transferase
VLNEAGYAYELVKVDLKTKTTENGNDFTLINSKSSVPVLELDNGEVITEVVAIVQYLVDQQAETPLAPKAGTLERARLHEWLNFIATEVHKTYSPIFHAAQVGNQARDYSVQKLKDAFDFVAARLEGKAFLMGTQFTIADAYLYTTLRWHKGINFDLSNWPVLLDYMQRIALRPKVQATLMAEGLLDKKAA